MNTNTVSKGAVPLAFCLIVVTRSFAQSEVEVEWQGEFDVSLFSEAHAVVETPDGGYVVGGSFGVARLDGGEVTWKHDWGLSGWFEGRGITVDAMSILTNGDLAVAGLIGILGKGYVARLDTNDGALVWESTWRGSWDFSGFSSVHETAGGQVIVAGSEWHFVGLNSSSFAVEGRPILIELDATGEVLTEKFFHTVCDCSSQVYSSQETQDGGFVLTTIETNELSTRRVLLLKIDSNRNEVWRSHLSGPEVDSQAYSVRETSDGGFIVAGDSLYRTDAEGNVVWTQPIVGDGRVVRETEDGGFLVLESDWHYPDPAAVRLTQRSSAGEIVADFLLGQRVAPGAFELTSDGGLIVVGTDEAATRKVVVTKISLPSLGGWQIPGDCTQDAAVDVSDATCLLEGLFQGGEIPSGDGTLEDPSNVKLLDIDGDENLTLTDAVSLLGFLFRGGEPPPLGTDCVRIPGLTTVCSP